MHITDTVVIGAGQAGLAVSRCLTEHGREHVVLDRGRVGQRWRSNSWDSLHLLTPNWMNTLPGETYAGRVPDGFASAAAFVEHLAGYAESFGAPVEGRAAVRLLRKRGDLFEVVTQRAVWRARSVVIATGWCDLPAVPAAIHHVAAGVHQLAASDYRKPSSLPDGGVLVVGASATGVQLADELRTAGRNVTIAVGRHTRMPRSYRGMDIYWWLDRLGLLDTTIDQVRDRELARREPSAQLVGRPDRRPLDLATLQQDGVRLVGRVVGIDGHRVAFADDLPGTIAAAGLRMQRLLGRIDRHIDAHGLRDEVLPADRLRHVSATPTVRDVDLRTAGIASIVWATGFRRSYPWLQLPALDRTGEIHQRRGRTTVPGLYVLGQRFQHYRNSNFIGGVGRDAAQVADAIAGRRRAAHDRSPART